MENLEYHGRVAGATFAVLNRLGSLYALYEKEQLEHASEYILVHSTAEILFFLFVCFYLLKVFVTSQGFYSSLYMFNTYI